MKVINPFEVDILTNGERYTLDTKLKKLLINEDCYIYVQPIINNLKPDFIVIGKKIGVLIIEVKDWGDDYIVAVNGQVVTSTNKKYKNPISQISTYSSVIRSKLSGIFDFIDMEGNLNVPIRSMIFYVNLTSETIVKHNSLTSSDVATYDKRDLRQLSLINLIGENTISLSDKETLAIRGVLFPEIIIPSETFSSNDELVEVDNIRALDYEQEEFSKKVPNGHYMVSGIPGSGKTVMLLSRALHLAQHNKYYKIIILTYTRALSNKLKHQLIIKSKEMQISDTDLERIEIKHFHKLCYDLVGYPAYTREDKEAYYDTFWPKEAIKAVKNNPKFDAVLVDEYQDFHADWFELCREICKKNSNGDENLFFAGDRLQRIYDVTWNSYKEIGINIQGRSKLLKTPYRTNQNHLDFSLKFLSLDEGLAKEIGNFYEIEKLNNFSVSKSNIDLFMGCVGSFTKYIEDLIVNSGVSPEDIIILCQKNYECLEMPKMMPKNISSYFSSGKEQIKGKGLITTYHSSKGLEAKYCILFKVDAFEVNKKNRTLVYVGMTRASEKLIIHYKNNDNFAVELTKMFSK